MKADQTFQKAHDATDPGRRAEYQKLARAYLNLADEADRKPVVQQQQPPQKK